MYDYLLTPDWQSTAFYGHGRDRVLDNRDDHTRPMRLHRQHAHRAHEGVPNTRPIAPLLMRRIADARNMRFAYDELCKKGGDALFPELSAAHAIHVGRGVLCDEIEARLLAGETPDAIASKAAIDEAVIATFADLFFGVGDCLGAGDWVAEHALVTHGGRHSEGDIWRWAAWTGGPTVLDLLVADHKDPHRDPDTHKLAEKIRLLYRFEQTPINHSNFPAFIKDLVTVVTARVVTDPTVELAKMLLYLEMLKDSTPASKKSRSKARKRPGVASVPLEDVRKPLLDRMVPLRMERSEFCDAVGG